MDLGGYGVCEVARELEVSAACLDSKTGYPDWVGRLETSGSALPRPRFGLGCLRTKRQPGSTDDGSMLTSSTRQDCVRYSSTPSLGTLVGA